MATIGIDEKFQKLEEAVSALHGRCDATDKQIDDIKLSMDSFQTTLNGLDLDVVRKFQEEYPKHMLTIRKALCVIDTNNALDEGNSFGMKANGVVVSGGAFTTVKKMTPAEFFLKEMLHNANYKIGAPGGERVFEDVISDRSNLSVKNLFDANADALKASSNSVAATKKTKDQMFLSAIENAEPNSFFAKIKAALTKKWTEYSEEYDRKIAE